VHEEWTSLWRRCHKLINWDIAPITNIGPGGLLNLQIQRNIERSLRTTLVAQLDEGLGIEKHQELEELGKSALEVPYRRLNAALSFNAVETQHLWNSFEQRLPDSFRFELSVTAANSDTNLPFSKKGPLPSAWLGAGEWYWLASSDFARKQVPIGKDVSTKLDSLINLSLAASSYLFCEHCCFVFLWPLEASFDDGWRLHHAEKPALEFSDGMKFYFWHGVELDEKIFTRPEKLKIRMIDNERNIEVRRAMIEKYGIENFIRYSGARKIQEDAFGILYSRDVPGDEPVVVVRVTNATPEPDGSFKEYFLRVPPETRSARQGVAWTFRMRENVYKPHIET
jgi:hypothetical protein